MTRCGSTYYYMNDAPPRRVNLGSVRNLVDANEAVQNTYDYRAFGVPITTTQNVTSPYHFTGREYESGRMIGGPIVKLRAAVRRITGRTKAYYGTIINGEVVRTDKCPDPAYVEIVERTEGFFLNSFTEPGEFISDTWHETMEEAKKQANWEFDIDDGDWRTVSDE